MFYLINKEKGISSFKAIKQFAKEIKATKIGHTGTLDPLASGLLLVATDEDTKLIQYIEDKTKAYTTWIKFGSQTSTYDEEGEILNKSGQKITFNQEIMDKMIEWFIKQNSQIPPIFSAKKINGVRSYDLAREGKLVELKEQLIKVQNAGILSFDDENQRIEFYLEVSNGTYIRSLANDLGIFMHNFAYMQSLERVKISSLDKSLLKNSNFAKIDITPLLRYEVIQLDNNEIKTLKNGISLPNKKHLKSGKYFISTNTDKETILGIIEAFKETIKPIKLFGNRLKNINY
ncbi:tRNA pseudouridine(55) synthase TruB [Mycoplasma sp. Mirounga ES2805-ORL]|uniref:tRNA pseudouridine(55) synthase TruB n=1 Tax=Mycoplasma sp. Mirounga ES2805-ORL TaxID=754514 RepID=UPI00197B680F|nr:tRNA pseudouridine(55) synthase TruB [Mycoplasma sp. Mirounga ES2805-ORL]QSF13688.1 tRNA pseudouridine(55) synthase TruB [Mycoplasma sp. Mirounga ES2805-ORL]